jgi:cell division protein FtsZ
MGKKRASMREGPLADLFRSTDESVGEDEVSITASAGSGVETLVEPEEIKVERVEVERVESNEGRGQTPVETEPEALVEERGLTPAVDEPGVEEVTPAVEEPEAFIDPVKDPAIEEMERRERAHHVIEEKEVRVEHEGLERLMGGTALEEDRPAFGRDEPDTARASTVPRTHQAVLRVVGVGGAGVNAVNRMVEAQVPGVEFVAINTDLQSLQNSNADVTLHIGAELTRGLGSGSDPRVGYRAAFDEQDKIKQLLKGSDMVFLAAGAGGGTGTGAAPVVAKLARDVGALTVAAVTKPFSFEGARRAAQAEEGIAALGAEVDTMIVVPNERLIQILERRTSMTDAFRVADDVLRQAVQGISDLVMLPGLINLDFADVRTTMLEAGDAILGIGMGVGEHRAMLAAEKAVSSPLLDSTIEGSHSLLLSITGGPDLSLIEASEAANIVQAAAHPDANIIFGASIDEDMSEEVWITVIATRFDSPFARRHHRDQRGGPREPRNDDGDDRRRDDRDRGNNDFGGPREYGDPVGDWRTDGDRRTRGARKARAEEIYGDGLGEQGIGRGQDRRPAMPGSMNGGLVLDVPEFIPGH